MIDVFGMAATVHERLAAIHAQVKYEFPAITRIAVAVYDEPTDILRTFIHSTDGSPPFGRAEDRLNRMPGLAELARRRLDRIVTNLGSKEAYPAGTQSSYREALASNGYLSSYTTPFYERESFLGFIFFDSPVSSYFSAPVVNRLSLYNHLISLFVIDFLRQSEMLRSAVAIARDFGIRRDKYTGTHLERMAHYSRIIAAELADTCDFGEDFVECVFLFAPLHDIGKIAIPDEILLKRGRLTPSEFLRMQQHVSEGVAIVDTIIETFRVESAQHAQTMKNVVRYHHERYDGFGYLDGLAGEAIPIEARIVSVADVFDALTNERPYKAAMSNSHAFDYLSEGGGTQFDQRCVDALIARRREVEEVQDRFNAVLAQPVAAGTAP